jgi:hypothetical protein
LTNEEALAIHNDPYGLQPIKVDEPTPGVQIWVKPMAIAGRRAVAILNRTDVPTQVKVNWEKLGLNGAPKSSRDVWERRDIVSVDASVSVPAHDLALMVVDGADKAPAEYTASQTSISGIQATRGPTFARLHYANTSGNTAILRMKDTSGLSTALSFPPTLGSETGTIGLILPNGTANLSFEGQRVAIRKLDVYSW